MPRPGASSCSVKGGRVEKRKAAGAGTRCGLLTQPAFEVRGVLSETIPDQLDLFASSRWPRRPYCTDDFEAGLKIRSLEQALGRRYIQANPPKLRVWSMFDVDRAGAAVAWEDADLPPPTWVTQNKANGHAHLVWGLTAPVLVDGIEARRAPLRYLAAVESMMREKLRADPGFGGLITKNPRHPEWRTLRGPVLGYELSELAECLPGLERHVCRRGAPEESGLGRNVTVFDHVRGWAYRAVREYRAAGGLDGWNSWLAAVYGRALARNGEFPVPMDPRECWWVARSVAKWTWQRMDGDSFSRWQAARGKKGGLAKGKAYEDKAASARLMRAAGRSLREIAAELGCSAQSVANWVSK